MNLITRRLTAHEPGLRVDDMLHPAYAQLDDALVAHAMHHEILGFCSSCNMVQPCQHHCV